MDNTNQSCVFFKKRSRQAVRAKKESSSSEEEAIDIKRKPKRQESSVLYQKTANFSKTSKDSSDDQDESTLTVAYKASHSAESRLSREQVATATLEIDTEHTRDAQAIFERAQQLNKQQGAHNSKVYLGANNYPQYIEKKDTVMGNASSGFNRKGPMRAPVNIRATVRWDYQPDICKDYKETGFCSFGDSCKFLHDRSDYKHGWQIDQELAEGTFGIEGSDNRYEILHHSSEEEGNAGEDIPWECLICRKDYKDPVVTICRHYFCEACALKWYRKTARCYICTTDTKGFFKFAKHVIPRVAELRAKSGKRKHDSDEDSSSGDERKVPSTQTDDISSATSADQSDTACTSTTILPVPPEPKWAQPEAPDFCDTDDESD